MIHVYKLGGKYKQNDTEYSIKCIEKSDLAKELQAGWFRSIEDANAIPHEPTAKAIDVDGGERERFLRDEIARMNGKAGGRCSMETLEAKYAELKAAETEAE